MTVRKILFDDNDTISFQENIRTERRLLAGIPGFMKEISRDWECIIASTDNLSDAKYLDPIRQYIRNCFGSESLTSDLGFYTTASNKIRPISADFRLIDEQKDPSELIYQNLQPKNPNLLFDPGSIYKNPFLPNPPGTRDMWKDIYLALCLDDPDYKNNQDIGSVMLGNQLDILSVYFHPQTPLLEVDPTWITRKRIELLLDQFKIFKETPDQIFDEIFKLGQEHEGYHVLKSDCSEVKKATIAGTSFMLGKQAKGPHQCRLILEHPTGTRYDPSLNKYFIETATSN